MTAFPPSQPADAADAFRALADKVLDGVATPQEEAQLARLVAESPTAAKTYAKRAWLDQMLEDVEKSAKNAGMAEAADFQPAPPDPMDGLATAAVSRRRTAGKIRRRRRSWLPWAAAASLAVAAGTTLLVAAQWRRRECPLLVAATGPAWEGPALAPGTALPLGSSWRLAKGHLDLRYPNGATVRLDAPAAFRIDSSGFFGGSGSLRLEEGQLLAHCGSAARGFTVTTPDATFRDLGTEFTVARMNGRASVLAVREGRVQAQSAGRPSVEIQARQTWQAGQDHPRSADPAGPLIAKNQVWAYLDGDAIAPLGWEQPTFNDSSWKQGQATLGYMLNPLDTTTYALTTRIAPGLHGESVNPVKWFRTRFETPYPAAIAGLQVQCNYDDGIVVYLNGREVKRYNMPTGPISSQTLAAGTAPWPVIPGQQDWTLPADALLPGTNVLAVSVHQAGKKSYNSAAGMCLSLEMNPVKAP